jgi:nucleoside 2-deoxyribosyltransferase
MSQETANKFCPVCGESYLKNSRSLESFPGLRNECERCGTYKIDNALIFSNDPPWAKVRHLVSAWVRRENNAGMTPIVFKGADIKDISNSEWWEKQFRSMGFPETTNEKLDALLLAYAESVSGNYQERVKIDRPELISIVAAKNIDEIKGLTDLLEQMGRLKKVEKAFGALTISAEGWLKIDEFRKANIASNTAFIAMWFSEQTRKYREAVIAALEHCGYRPIVIDQEQYSGFIMDQVVSLLRQARFVIADFTCRAEKAIDGGVIDGVRGGVYWESGMAYGLGKPLIHTCEDNPESKARIHFDVDQYNTIFWQQDNLNTDIRPIEETNKNSTFAEMLVARILALVGQGNYKAE